MGVSSDQYLSAGQLAELFGVHRATVYRWIAKNPGFPQAIRPAGARGTCRWIKKEVDAWAARQRS